MEPENTPLKFHPMVRLKILRSLPPGKVGDEPNLVSWEPPLVSKE